MSSGAKQVVVNQQERAVSADINRLQALGDAELAEAHRYLLDVYQGTDDVQAGGLCVESTTSSSPMQGEVLGGLCVLPQIGSLNLLVSAGVLLCIDPDLVVSPDDSPYKYVQDPGVTVLGALPMNTNPTTNPVVAVIESSRQTTALETDSRDIFDPVTALYTATTVTKVAGSTLVYRVRYGSSGGGFPGTATGWLPLCVASLPPGATTCDQMTFWDVRPLVGDRAFPANLGLAYPRRLRGEVNGTAPATTTGIFELVGTDGRRAGGQLLRGTPGTEGTSWNPNDTANQDPALVASPPANGALVTACLAFPFSLPRWATYTTVAAGQRLPRSPRGIPVVTAAPFGGLGLPEAGNPVGIPTSCGFGSGVTTTKALAMYQSTWNTTGPTLNKVRGGDAGGYFVDGGFPPAGTLSAVGSNVTATLVAGTHFPASAKSLCLRLQLNTTVIGSAGANAIACYPSAAGGAPDNQIDQFEYAYLAGSAPQQNLFTRWVTLSGDYPANDQPTYQVTFGTTGVGDSASATSSSCAVVGWRL